MWLQLVEKFKLSINGGLNLKCRRPWGGFHSRCLWMGRNTATILSRVQGWVVAGDVWNSTLWPFAVLGIYCFFFTSVQVCPKGEHKALICCLSAHSFSRNPLQQVAMLSQALVNTYFPSDHGIVSLMLVFCRHAVAHSPVVSFLLDVLQQEKRNSCNPGFHQDVQSYN